MHGYLNPRLIQVYFYLTVTIILLDICNCHTLYTYELINTKCGYNMHRNLRIHQAYFYQIITTTRRAASPSVEEPD